MTKTPPKKIIFLDAVWIMILHCFLYQILPWFSPCTQTGSWSWEFWDHKNHTGRLFLCTQNALQGCVYLISVLHRLRPSCRQTRGLIHNKFVPSVFPKQSPNPKRLKHPGKSLRFPTRVKNILLRRGCLG